MSEREPNFQPSDGPETDPEKVEAVRQAEEYLRSLKEKTIPDSTPQLEPNRISIYVLPDYSVYQAYDTPGDSATNFQLTSERFSGRFSRRTWFKRIGLGAIAAVLVFAPLASNARKT